MVGGEERPVLYLVIGSSQRERLDTAPWRRNARRTHRPETGGGGMWRGGRGKAERARGRAGSETSGESVGK